jgi:hypothetical protein
MYMEPASPLYIRVDIDAASTGGWRVRLFRGVLLTIAARAGRAVLCLLVGALVLRRAVGLAIAASILWLTTLGRHPLANLPKRRSHFVIVGLLVWLYAAFQNFVKFRLEPFQLLL